MNYYRRFIADFASKTRHLSMLEIGAYDTLLDVFYSTEKPLTKNRDEIYRICRAFSAEEKAAVDRILDEFWDINEKGFTNKRAKKEIKLAQSAIKASKVNGKKGGRPKTQRKPSGFVNENPELTQALTQKNHPPTPNHQPPQKASSNPNFSQDTSAAAVLESTAKIATAAFLDIGFDQPFGQTAFQAVWFSRYAEAKGKGEWLSSAMEQTIQECQAEKIKIPPQFFQAKRDVEKFDQAEFERLHPRRVPL